MQVNGHEVRIEKDGFRTAYARNGNAHAPTKYHYWSAWVDDAKVVSGRRTKREALEIACEYILSGEVDQPDDHVGGEAEIVTKFGAVNPHNAR